MSEVSPFIFISYGRDNYAVFAQRLKADLESFGYNVWFDQDRLKEGKDWELYIEQGLKRAQYEQGRVIFIMTPHSVRRPDGYCLNELAMALSLNISIVPVMLAQSEPPLSIARLQYLDLRRCWSDQNLMEGHYRESLESIRSLIQSEYELDHEGQANYLFKALHPIEFNPDLDIALMCSSSDIIKREKIVEQVLCWEKLTLEDPRSKILHITGSAGSGKTTLASWLSTREMSSIKSWHFCRRAHEVRGNPRRCVMSIAYYLATSIPQMFKYLNNSNINCEEHSDPTSLFQILINKPLRNMDFFKGSVIILIDALDEIDHNGYNPILSLINNQLLQTPSWLRLIITSRPLTHISAPHTHINLDTCKDEARQDIGKYIKKATQQNLLLDLKSLEQLVDRCAGSFLYASLVCRSILNQNKTEINIDELPVDLSMIYYEMFSYQFSDHFIYDKMIRPAFQVISQSKSPLTQVQLQECLAWTDFQIAEFLNRTQGLITLNQNTTEPQGGLRFSHTSLLEWLTSPQANYLFKLDAKVGLDVIIEWGERELKARKVYASTNHPLKDYCFRYLVSHLCDRARCGDLDLAINLMTDIRYLTERCKNTGVYSLIEDLRKLDISLSLVQLESRVHMRLVSMILSCLEQNASFINRHIGANEAILFQSLWNSIYWYCDEDFPQNAHLVLNLSEADKTELKVILDYWRGLFKDQEWIRTLTPPSLDLNAVRARLNLHQQSVKSFVVSKSREMLISASLDQTVKFWDLNNYSLLIDRELKMKVDLLAISDNERWLVAVRKGKSNRKGSAKLVIIDLNQNTSRTIDKIGSIRAIKPYRSESFIVVTHDKISKINLLSQRDEDGSICLESVFELDHELKVHSILINHNQTHLYLAIHKEASNEVYIEERALSDLSIVTQQCNQEATVSCMIQTNDGDLLVGYDHGDLCLFNINPMKKMHSFKSKHQSPVISLIELLDTHQFVSATEDGYLLAYDKRRRKIKNIRKIHLNRINHLATFGDLILSASDDRSLCILKHSDLSSKMNLDSHDAILSGHFREVRSIQFSQSGEYLLSTSKDQKIILWSSKSFRPVGIIEGHTDVVKSAQFSPDETQVVSTSRDGTVRFWSIDTKKELFVLPYRIQRDKIMNCAIFSPDGRFAYFAGDDQRIGIVDLERGEITRELSMPGEVYTLDIHGRFLVAAGGNKSQDESSSLIIWCLDSVKPHLILKAPKKYGWIIKVAFSKEGDHVFATYWNQGTVVWDLSSEKIIDDLIWPGRVDVRSLAMSYDDDEDREEAMINDVLGEVNLLMSIDEAPLYSIRIRPSEVIRHPKYETMLWASREGSNIQFFRLENA